MSAPTVINIRNAPCGWKTNSNFVYIGRFHRSSTYGLIQKSKWHNPFRGERGESIEKFKEYLIKSDALKKCLPELEGKVLVCWCKPARCHGDVIREVFELECLLQR